MNKYDLEHVLTAHPAMSQAEWEGIYRDAWKIYYTDEHVATVLRRAIAVGIDPKKMIDPLTIFSGATMIEGVHPLQFGFVRRKIRSQRRHGMKIENPVVFYPRLAAEFIGTAWRWLRLARRYRAILRDVIAESKVSPYMDEALTPPVEGDATPSFVQAYADKIPHTHGAPVREGALAG